MESHATLALSSIPVEIRELVKEYAEIFVLQRRTDEQSTRFEKILDLACSNSELHFWISETEHILGHHLGYFADDLNEYYMNQKAKLIEYFVESRSDVCDRDQAGSPGVAC